MEEGPESEVRGFQNFVSRFSRSSCLSQTLAVMVTGDQPGYPYSRSYSARTNCGSYVRSSLRTMK